MTRFGPGPLNPNWKGGRYASVLPTKLQEKFHQATADPELLNQRAEIALLTARMEELVSNISTGESGAVWKKLNECAKDLIKAKQYGDDVAFDAGIKEMLGLITQGKKEFFVWDEIQATALNKAKLIESERKRILETKLFLTAEQGVNMLAKVADALRKSLDKRVEDERVRRAVKTDVSATIMRLMKIEEESISDKHGGEYDADGGLRF